MNPLFPHQDQPEPKQPANAGYVLSRQHGQAIQPPAHTGKNAALEVLRHKVDALFQSEPDARQELQESGWVAAARRSKHQQFMHDLSSSGKSLAQIQVEWHKYYTSLPDSEKHEVWQEFYEANSRSGSPYARYAAKAQADAAVSSAPEPDATPQPKVVVHEQPAPAEPVSAKTRRRGVAHLKKRVLGKVQLSANTQAKVKDHFKSLVFGLGTGALVILIFLFGFFNEVIIAPFIQPSRHVGATPIIISSDSVASTSTPEVIIPKTNVEIPVIYNQTSVNEEDMQNSLQDGVVHYPSTVQPGQKGNTAFFGHSSNNIFNKGKYKFAFVLLHELVPGDLFYLTNGGKVYTYKVYDKKIVDPSDIGVLNAVPDKAATATLITCDPPGTSLHRLVVWGEQVSPDPSGAAAPAAEPAGNAPAQLADNGPTLFSRFLHWLF